MLYSFFFVLIPLPQHLRLLLPGNKCDQITIPAEWCQQGMWSRSPDGLKTHQHLISVLSWHKNDKVSSRLFTSRAQEVIVDQIVLATLITWAKSVLAIYGSVNLNTENRLMHHLMIGSFRFWRVHLMTGFIITCIPILAFRLGLVS